MRKSDLTGGYHGWMQMLTKQAGWILMGCCVALAVKAEEPESVDFGKDYLIGLSLGSSTTHMGDRDRQVNVKPVFAFQVGRLRVSRSRASTLMNAGRGSSLETGVSTELLARDDWSLSASLRMDNGRKLGDDPVWKELPEIDDTVRVRLTARKRLNRRWSTNLSADQDILGKQGGARLNAGVSYRLPASEMAHWDFSVNTGWGNSRYMQTHYGISTTTARRIGVAPYRADGGIENLQIGADYTHALGENWVLFGGLNVSRLMRSALDSPLVNRGSTYGVSVGLAWRSSRAR